MFIAIDSAENMEYTGTISGSFPDLYENYLKITEIFKRYNVKPPFHWREIRKKVKEACCKEFLNIINNSRFIVNIFHHRRLLNMSRENLFFELLPQHISLRLSPWIRELVGNLVIYIDNDYRFKNNPNTINFLKHLVENLCFMLVGLKIDSRKENNVIRAEIKLRRGVLSVYGNVVKSDEYKAIQILDLVLGYYIQFRCKFKRNVVHYWEIFRK